MKFPDRFLRYFLILTLLLIVGIGTVSLQSAMDKRQAQPFGKNELQQQYDYHGRQVMPFIEKSYLRLLFSNSGVALFLLLVPLFWVWVWWFRRDMRDTVILFMQGSVGILIWAVGHNSFTKLYMTFRTLPPGITATMYLPHGILEMPAFILAGTFSLLCIDELRTFLKEKNDSPDLHPGEISLFIFGKVWRWFVLVFILIAVAAAIECFVTPQLVKAGLEVALQNS
jgi:uncharacterized membrane protein SpoIIM required for sporulation